MASIRKRGSNSYLIVVSRGYDYEGNRLKSVQKTVKPPKEYTPKQAEKWVKEQAILFEREVQHTPEPINRSITLAKYIEHWAADIGPKKLADSTYQRDLQDMRRILPTLGNYKLTDLRKEVIRDFYEEMRHSPRLDGRGNLSEKSVEGLHNTLCGILSAAVDEGYLTHNPAWRCYKPNCYQLGILPKKQQPRINRPELQRIWKDTEKILEEHAFVHDHKFSSLQAIVDYRKGLSQQIETLAAQRAEIVKQMRRRDAPPELADRRAMLTCKIAELRKEDKIAEGAIKRIQRTRESNRIDQENQYTNNKNRRRNRSRQR